jgi:pilus assembly protein TadC
MYEELRKEAEKKVKAKMSFFIIAIVFALTGVVLLMLSFYLPSISFWLRLPIPVLIMVLGIVYFSVFGLPATGITAADWKEEEIEREIIKLYRQKKAQISPPQALSETEILELKELERLEKGRAQEEDFV